MTPQQVESVLEYFERALEKHNQAELGRLTGIQASALSHLTKKKRAPTLTQAYALARVLNLSVHTVLGDYDPADGIPLVKLPGYLPSEAIVRRELLPEYSEVFWSRVRRTRVPAEPRAASPRLIYQFANAVREYGM